MSKNDVSYLPNMGINNAIIAIVTFIRRGLNNFPKGLRPSNSAIIVLGVFLVALSGGGYLALRKGATEPLAVVSKHSVVLKSVAELSSETSPLTIVGQVSSKSEATVRAESAGQIIGVYAALGDSIKAGAIAAEIENASQRAVVLQAQGSVDAALANLSKITGGARSEQRAILQANLTTARASLEASRTGAVNALLSAYSTADNAISGTTDKMFTTPQIDTASFIVTSSDYQLTTQIENTRLTIRKFLARENTVVDTLSPSSDLAAEITTTTAEIRSMRNFVDLIIADLNKGVPTPSASAADIASYLALATAARTTLNASLASLSAATQGLAASQATLEIAQKNLEQGLTGGQEEDVAVAQAALKQAQGSLAGAIANLEKTIIRAPIGGTINSFSLKKGDYVQQSSPVLTVANNGALEVLAYVTEGDAREIAVGQKVTIESATGVVTRIAPALDPLTKKIEVRIGVGSSNGLVNGQSVLVSIPRGVVGSGISRITIPISALKMSSDKATVFTVENQKLVAHDIVLGALLGDRVVVSSGVTTDMYIVTDARGLREGEEVDVAMPTDSRPVK